MNQPQWLRIATSLNRLYAADDRGMPELEEIIREDEYQLRDELHAAWEEGGLPARFNQAQSAGGYNEAAMITAALDYAEQESSSS